MLFRIYNEADSVVYGVRVGNKWHSLVEMKR